MTGLAPQACDLIIEAGWVVPVVPHGVVLEDHAVVVTGGRIEAVLRLLAEIARGAAVNTRGGLPRAAVPAASATTRSARSRAGSRSTGVPPRSEDGEYCWYASWLYARHRQGFQNGFWTGLLQNITPGYPGDEVWLTTDQKCLVLRRATVDDAVLHRADAPFAWHQAPQFAGPASREHFSFGAISPAFLEDWTRATAILQKSAAGFWHAVAMGMGEDVADGNWSTPLREVVSARGCACSTLPA